MRQQKLVKAPNSFYILQKGGGMSKGRLRSYYKRAYKAQFSPIKRYNIFDGGDLKREDHR